MELVRDKAILRRLIEIANETITDAYDAPGEARELLDRTESNLAIIRAENDLAKTRTVKEAINWTLDDLARRIDGTGQAGLATGFPALDRLAGGGLKAGELFVIAARPSMGKTSLMMNMVEHVCLDGGLPTMVFSTEMTTNQLVQRLVYSRSKFNLASLAQGSKPDKGTLQRLQRASRPPVLVRERLQKYLPASRDWPMSCAYRLSSSLSSTGIRTNVAARASVCPGCLTSEKAGP